MAKILVTGSTGFIGKRLIYQLLGEGHEVYALTRIRGIHVAFDNSPHLHFIVGDLRDPSKIEAFPKDLDAAYYLVHSMGNVVSHLVEVEENICRNFIAEIEKTFCRQIVYLGGIIENEKELSPHLKSRLHVEHVLKSSHIPCTILRASLIIGAGSASFEIIRDLVEKLPIMVAPKWIHSLCQPISIDDVLFYLSTVLLNPECFHKTLDIGGPEGMSFKETLMRYAAFRKLKRYIFVVPVLTPKLSSYWLVLVTSVRYSICAYLVESMRHNTLKLNRGIDHLIPHACSTYEETLEVIFDKIVKNEVISTWMDDWELKKVNADIEEFVEVPKEGCLKDEQRLSITVPIEEVEKRIWSIGGKEGWHSMNWAWKMRGFLDKLFGGTGLNRGRRHPSQLQVGDAIDFWRVLLADKEKKHVILYAEMKLPGEAWLEFEIDSQKKELVQTATFRPKGVFGRLYWYVCFPFHFVIFRNMAKMLAQEEKAH